MLLYPDGDGMGMGAGTGTGEDAASAAPAGPGAGGQGDAPAARTFTEAEVEGILGGYRNQIDQWLSSGADDTVSFLEAKGYSRAQAKAAVAAAQPGAAEDPGFEAWLARQPKSVQEKLGGLGADREATQSRSRLASFQHGVEALVGKMPLGAKDSRMRRVLIKDAVSRILDDDVSPEEAVSLAHQELEADLAEHSKATVERTRKERLLRAVTPGGQAAGASRKDPASVDEGWDMLAEDTRAVHRAARGH